MEDGSSYSGHRMTGFQRIVLCFVLFEIQSHYGTCYVDHTGTGLELTEITCFSLPTAEMKGVPTHHA